MKNNALILSLFFLFCAISTKAQPVGYDERCDDYLVNFCKDILAKNTGCLQWDGRCSSADNITRTGGVMIGAHSLLGNKLVVTGGIISTSLRVSTATWPDYVFDKSYQLMPLADVKSFINAHKHLPNTPSETDIDKNGGFNIGEVFVNHQEKIEEIFLHLISLKKQATALQKEEADLDIEQIDLTLTLSEKMK
jgi:hypothetical protein